MEEEKKKKKNKKKKNKQATKPTEGVTLNASKSTLEGQNHVLELEQNSNGEVSGVIDSSNDSWGRINVDSSVNYAKDSEGDFPVHSQKKLAESEKQYREASFQEKITELEAENDALMQKEGFLEERINQLLEEKPEIAQKEASEREKVKQLQNEKNASIQNEALLEEKIKKLQKEMDENAQKQASEREDIKQLYDEKNASLRNEASLKERLAQLENEKEVWSRNEGILEQKILQLQWEVEAYQQKEGSLETKILQLEGEKDSLVQKEDKINQLVDEAAFSNLTEVSLQEKIKQMEKERDLWTLKESSAKELVASLTDENNKLRAQVIEMEHCWESLLEDKLKLTQTVSSLQLQISNLETAAAIHLSSVDKKVTSEDGDSKYQLEAACVLIEKLVTENSELVEKMNELYADLDQMGVRTGQFSSDANRGTATYESANSSVFEPNLTILVNSSHNANQATDLISEASEMIPVSKLLEDVIVEDQRNSEIYDGCGPENSSEIIEVDEIVQIPLDETEIKESDVGLPQDDDVGLADAPLIGAPLRFISFVVGYVSGADLVDKNSEKLGY